jgi:hypothetical protein
MTRDHSAGRFGALTVGTRCDKRRTELLRDEPAIRRGDGDSTGGHTPPIASASSEPDRRGCAARSAGTRARLSGPARPAYREARKSQFGVRAPVYFLRPRALPDRPVPLRLLPLRLVLLRLVLRPLLPRADALRPEARALVLRPPELRLLAPLLVARRLPPRDVSLAPALVAADLPASLTALPAARAALRPSLSTPLAADLACLPACPAFLV